jgi:hypothetical protein
VLVLAKGEAVCSSLEGGGSPNSIYAVTFPVMYVLRRICTQHLTRLAACTESLHVSNSSINVNENQVIDNIISIVFIEDSLDRHDINSRSHCKRVQIT